MRFQREPRRHDVIHRQRRCSQSHCSGYSRTQPSTTDVTACMVRAMSTRPSASRAGSIGFGDLRPKAVAVGLANGAHAADRGSGLRGEERDEGIGHASAPEKDHLDAFAEMLIDQHADMHAGLRQPRQPHRRGKTGRDQFAHQRRAQLDDEIG